MENLKNFHYSNVQKQSGGAQKKHTVRKVIIRNGKGYKSVTSYSKNKKTKTIKKPIPHDHVIMIYHKQFIPGLFADCYPNCKNKNKNKNKTKKIIIR